jgi:hypothetical protein
MMPEKGSQLTLDKNAKNAVQQEVMSIPLFEIAPIG